MKANFEILSISIIHHNCDIVRIRTNLLSPIWPYRDNLVLQFDAANGQKFVKEHFGIDVEIRDGR